MYLISGRFVLEYNYRSSQANNQFYNEELITTTQNNMGIDYHKLRYKKKITIYTCLRQKL